MRAGGSLGLWDHSRFMNEREQLVTDIEREGGYENGGVRGIKVGYKRSKRVEHD